MYRLHQGRDDLLERLLARLGKEVHAVQLQAEGIHRRRRRLALPALTDAKPDHPWLSFDTVKSRRLGSAPANPTFPRVRYYSIAPKLKLRTTGSISTLRNPEMTFYEAALRVLEAEGHPLHFSQITEKSIQQSLLSHVGK